MEATMAIIKQLIQTGRQIVWDADGTLNDFFDQPYHIERMCDEGFFRNLNPYSIGVSFFNDLIEKHGANPFFVCTSVHKENLAQEKIDWFAEHVPNLPSSKVIVIQYSVPKSDYIGNLFKQDAVLIDDYTRNLLDWERRGGLGIKAINTINHKKGVWKGLTLEVV